MPFYAGYVFIGGSTWNTDNAGGNLNGSYFPRTGTPHLSLDQLPANFRLVELGAYLNVSSSHATQIDLGVYKFATSSALADRPLLYSQSVALDAADGTGWRWIVAPNLNVDLSAESGSRLFAAFGRPQDGQRVEFRFQSAGSQGGTYISSAGEQRRLPSPWVGGTLAEFVSVYAVFKSTLPYVIASSAINGGSLARLSDDPARGNQARIVPY